MFRNLAQLLRYRALIQSLVARELKARYRGSVLGFFWSFINPLLLLLVYSVVFAYIMPARFTGGVQATTVLTPATFAGMMLICAEPNIGYRPPGM